MALLLSFSVLSGCAYNIKTERSVKPVNARFKNKKEVINGLLKNYGNFKGMSGRIDIEVNGKNFSFNRAGLYRYIKNEYVRFVIPDMYGNILLYAKITKSGGKVVFFNTRRNRFESIYLNKKYSGKRLMYEQLFKLFKIFLNLNSIVKIKKSNVFYNTPDGFFFEYREKSDNYYIYVNSKYLIDKITVVRLKNNKMLESVVFKDYISKGGVKVPLKINIEDYLYNVKIKVMVSKGAKVFYINNFNGEIYEK